MIGMHNKFVSLMLNLFSNSFKLLSNVFLTTSLILRICFSFIEVPMIPSSNCVVKPLTSFPTLQ